MAKWRISLCRLFLGSAVIILVTASSASSQWTMLRSFPAQVRSVYFLDQQGSGTTGFAGLSNSTIWRTTDNGGTWAMVTTPSTAFSVQITHFAFRNALQGWCSVRTFGNFAGAIWTTTDGGLTWSAIYSAGGFVSIGFCVATNVLVAPCWSTSGFQSTDFGVTWTSNSPAYQDGVTFSGSNGVIGNLSAPNPLYSNDGGANWYAAPSLNAETWSPYGIPGTTTFVAAAEKTHQFFVSTNGGALWTNPYTFPTNAVLTGCIMGTLANLFVQTNTNGFYYSTDVGTTWFSICGPKNSLDTRFYSKGKEIFAGDIYGNLWYNPDGTSAGAATLSFDKIAITYSGVRCATYDSIIHFNTGVGCTSAILTKVQILSGAPAFSIGAISLPRTVMGKDSLGVLYSPSSSLNDSGKLLLEFNLGTRTVDTIITLYGTARNSSSYRHAPSLVLSSPYACMTKDSMLVIHNLSCDTLTIIRDSLSDSSHFQLFPFRLPHKIAPFDSATILIIASSLHDGTFTSILELEMIGGTSVPVNDQVPLTLNVLQGAEAQFGALNVSVLNRCVSLDTLFPITNTKCDSIILLKASLSDSSVFRIGALTLPMVIQAANRLGLPIHIVPGSKGTYTTRLQLRYVSGQKTVDTSITFTTQVLSDIPLQLALKNTRFDMGVLGVPCSASAQWITFSNTLCRDLTVEHIAWEGADSQYWFDPKTFPVTLGRDTGIDSILVHFKPSSATVSSKKLRVTLDLDGVEIDTVLTFFGSGVSEYHDSLLTPTLSYDTLLECQSIELEGEIINLSCDSAIATSATIAGNDGYTVISPTFPKTIYRDSTLHVRFKLQPKHSGATIDSAVVVMHNPVNGSDYTHTIALMGYIIPSIHALSVSNMAFALNAIAPCSFVDSFVVLTNSGNCDDVIITDTSLAGYSGIALLAPFTLPIVIHPDSSIRIAFRILPNDSVAANSQIIFRGQNIDTTITFSYSSLPGAHALSVATPDPIFLTRPCVPVSKTLAIANVGCDSVLFDRASLFGLPNATQFVLQNLPKLPVRLGPGDTLRFNVLFDPNGSGDGLATLNVDSRQAKYFRQIGLSGSVTGTVPTARIALEASDRSMQCAGKAKDTTSVVAVVLDDVGDSTQLSTVTLTLHANGNLLTLAKIVTASGWSLLDTMTKPDGSFDVLLKHDAGGAVGAETELVRCYFSITIGDSMGCDIGMSNVRFNDSSASYEGCVLASIAMPDPVRFSSLDTCGTPLMRGLLTGRLALRIISIVPNPVTHDGGDAHATLTFENGYSGMVTTVIRDLLGRERWRMSAAYAAGMHTVQLELPLRSEGEYFAEVFCAGQRQVRKIVVEGGPGKN